MSGTRELAERFITSLEARDWVTWAGLLHPGVVYEIPQSRERIRGCDRYLRFNREYPGDWHLRPKVVVADEQHGGGPTNHRLAVSTWSSAGRRGARTSRSSWPERPGRCELT